MESCSLVNLFAFQNEAMLFAEVLHSVKFALLTIAGTSANISKANFAFGLHYVDELNQENRQFSLSAEDIELFNPNTRTCPTFLTRKDVELTKIIYTRVPILIKEGLSEEIP